MRRAPLFIITLLLLLFARRALAHVGSPDIVYEDETGPYRLLVSIQPPEVVPGVADLGIRVQSASVTEIRVLALPMTLQTLPPAPEKAQPSSQDPQYYVSHVWLTTPGSWKVQILVDGSQGHAELSLPVPTLPQRKPEMDVGLAIFLGALLLLLGASAGAIVRA